MWKRFVRRVTLRPFGGTLCAPSTALWMSFAAIGVMLMAGAESAAWGYVGFFLGTGWLRYFAGLLMAVTAFLGVWIVDSTFLTLDLRRADYEKRLARLGVHTAPGGPWQKLKASMQSATGGVIVRMAMVAGSLLVAAPYVSQLFFYRDVSVVLNRQDLANVQAARNRVEATHDQKIQRLENEQKALRAEMVLEAAGQGPSKRFGRGATVKTMEDRMVEIGRKLDAARQAKATELDSYDNLPPDERANKYGVSVGRDGIQARNEAMETIATRPGYARTEWTIRAFLFGLFLILLMMKLYQPQTAKVYYSEFCQDSYKRYRAGQFDHRLPDAEKIGNNGDMTPLRFDEWLHTDYADYERDTRNATILGGINARRQIEEDNFKQVQTAAEADVAPLIADLDDELDAVTALEEEFANAESELVALDDEIRQHREAIADIDQAMAYPRAVGGGPGGFVRALDTREQWRTGLADREKKRRAVELRRDTANVRRQAAHAEIDRIQMAIVAKSAVLSNVDQRIEESRNRALDDIKSKTI